MKRKVRIGRLAMLAIGVLLITGGSFETSAECGKDGCCRKGQQSGYGAGKGMKGGGDGHHEKIQALLDHHKAIERHVEEIEGGVETVTTSEDPKVTEMIREHVGDMKVRVESGKGMRWWDPTFAELFKHADKIEMYVENIEGGVRVRETSADPDVVLLIRQHAIRGVSEFVAEGRARASQETPLPEGYGQGAAGSD